MTKSSALDEAIEFYGWAVNPIILDGIKYWAVRIKNGDIITANKLNVALRLALVEQLKINEEPENGKLWCIKEMDGKKLLAYTFGLTKGETIEKFEKVSNCTRKAEAYSDPKFLFNIVQVKLEEC